MGNLSFLVSYVNSCTSGKLAIADCSVVWQLGVIVVLLLLAISTLVVMRIRAHSDQTPVG